MKNIDSNETYIYQLKKTIKQLNRYSQKVLNQNGIYITRDQWELVKLISEQEGISQKEVAQATHKDPASITRTIDLLAKNGIVIREYVETDRRSYALYLTDAGESLVRKTTPLAAKIKTKGMAGIKKSDQEKLSEILNSIYNNVS